MCSLEGDGLPGGAPGWVRHRSARLASAVGVRQEHVGRGGVNGVGSRSVGDAFRSGQQRLDPVGDVLRRRAELGDGPVGGVAFGDIVWAGVIDEALGEGGGQHQLAFGDGDEAVPQAVKPELVAAGLADAAVEMVDILHMAGGAGGRGKHPVANAGRVVVGRGQAAFENGRELPGGRPSPCRSGR